MIYYKKGLQMIVDFLKETIGLALKLLMYPIIFGGGLALLIYSLLAIKKDIEIKNIVFAQAYEEKYMFKSPKLKESYEDWTRRMIKNGEIK